MVGVQVFIEVKIWLKRSVSKLEGGGMGRGLDRLEERCGEQRSQVEACREMDVGEKRRQVGARKGSHEMAVI
jgi:hypothetical protein